MSLALAIVLWLAVLIPELVVENGSLGSVAVVALALLFVTETRAPTLALVYRKPWISIAIGVVAGTVAQLAIDPLASWAAAELTGDAPDLSNLANVQGNLGNYLVLLAAGLLYGGVLEEVVNRGFLIGWGAARFGERFALPLMLVSSAAFGIAHVWQGPAGMITTGVSGLVYGLVYVACGRKLLPVMVTHGTSNLIGVTAIYLYGTG
jgi:membrane protease YdiL (CAAX protease family)